MCVSQYVSGELFQYETGKYANALLKWIPNYIDLNISGSAFSN